MRLSVAETICESMAHAAEDLDISAIAVFTETGTTARQLSKYRPKSPIFGLSSVEAVIHRMTLLWGVHPILCNKLATAEQMVETAERLLEEGGHVQPREILGIVAGTRTKSGSTNFLRLHVLGDTLSEASLVPRRGAGPSPRQAAGQVQKAVTRHCPGGRARAARVRMPQAVKRSAVDPHLTQSAHQICGDPNPWLGRRFGVGPRRRIELVRSFPAVACAGLGKDSRNRSHGSHAGPCAGALSGYAAAQRLAAKVS